MTNSNVSVICQRLEKNGFLNRIRDICTSLRCYE
ncbi:hypothetical protein ACTPEM_22780 [Clostridioides difficile]